MTFLTIPKKKFVTKFVTHNTKFVTCVRKFVTAVTKFVIKNILADNEKYQGERKKYQGEKKNFQAANGCGLRVRAAVAAYRIYAESSFFALKGHFV